MSRYQFFPDLDAATDSALRDSIARFGVLQPVHMDQHGNILDGHQRVRIATELGRDWPTITIDVADEAEAEAIARTLNADRRHLTPEQRREQVAYLREQGHSLRAIAGAVGVDEKTVRKDVGKIADRSAIPVRVQRRGGGTYPAERPAPVVTPTGESPAVREARLAFERRLDTVGVGTDEGQRLLEDETAGLPTPEHLAEVAANREAAYDANFPGWREEEAASAARGVWANTWTVLRREIRRQSPADVVPLIDPKEYTALRLDVQEARAWLDQIEGAMEPRGLHLVGGKS